MDSLEGNALVCWFVFPWPGTGTGLQEAGDSNVEHSDVFRTAHVMKDRTAPNANSGALEKY